MKDTHNADYGRDFKPNIWLEDRAESYWRDSRTFAAEGDPAMAAAYRCIADELRKCADLLGEELFAQALEEFS